MGEGAATQPEVIAASNVVLRVKPQVSISLHSYGKWIMYSLMSIRQNYNSSTDSRYRNLVSVLHYLFESHICIPIGSLSNLKAICRTKVADVLGIHDAAGYR